MALLFNLQHHSAISKIQAKGNVIYKSRQIGAYDDFVLLGLNETAVRITFTDLEKWNEKGLLNINEEKAEYMWINRIKPKTPQNNFEIDHFKKAPEFTYLG